MKVQINEEVAEFYSTPILNEACFNFGIDNNKAKLIRGNANLIFDCEDKILRLSHSIFRTKKEMEPELDWLIFLNERQLPVVEIVLSKTKDTLVQIGDDDNYFIGVCFKKIQGTTVTKEEWNSLHFEKLGQLTGMLHKEGQNYIEQQHIEYKHWNEIIEFSAWKYFPKDDRNLLELHDCLVNEFLTYPKTDTNYGLIHYDIHQGNYLLAGKEKQLILLDFEMICKSWYVNDVATVLHYANYHPASDKMEDFDNYPKFVLYRDLLVYGFIHRLFPSKATRKPKQGYFDKLSASIEKRRKKLNI